MNIWQPQWTDENTVNFKPSDTKFTRMKYFVLDLGRVYRNFYVKDSERQFWNRSKSNLVFEDLELRFRFTFDRGTINKYIGKGLRCPYATALAPTQQVRCQLRFMQTASAIDVGGGNLSEVQEYEDQKGSSMVEITSSANDLVIKVKPRYYIFQADESTTTYPQGLVQFSYSMKLPSIMLWLPDIPEYKTLNDVFSKREDESVIKFQIWSTRGQYYANQKGSIRLSVYNLGSAGTAWRDLGIEVTGDSWSPKLYINENQPNDWRDFKWNYIEDPRTWFKEIEKLPVPLPVNSRSHHNYSWSENGIKYISTGPSSKVLEEEPNKKSHWIVALFNKLTKRRNNEK